MAGTGPQNLSKPQAVNFVLFHLHLLIFLAACRWMGVVEKAESSSPLSSL